MTATTKTSPPTQTCRNRRCSFCGKGTLRLGGWVGGSMARHFQCGFCGTRDQRLGRWVSGNGVEDLYICTGCHQPVFEANRNRQTAHA